MSRPLPQIDEDLSIAIPAIIEEQLSSSYTLLREAQAEQAHEVIHDLRKSFKKLRAAFRLVKEAVGQADYEKENSFYRDLGREISDIRDHTAVIEALEQLRSTYQKQLTDNTFAATLASLHHRRQQREKYFFKNDRLGYLQKELHNKLKEPRVWLPKAITLEQTAAGFKNVYKKGQQAMEISKASHRTEHLHEWRKQVKYLRYQCEILSAIWPEVMDSSEKELQELSDLLGDDHDLSMISKQIDDNMVDFEDVIEKAMLIALIAHSRNWLQQRAFAKGECFYQEKPEDFINKITHCLYAYESEHKQNTSGVSDEGKG